MQREGVARMDRGGLSRRDLVKAAGAPGALAAARQLPGQKVAKSTAKGGRIDVHHHHSPPALRTGQAGTNRAGTAGWTPEVSLRMMDKFDIAVAILSMTQMGDILCDNTEKGRATVRLGNEYGARVMADHPKRFGLFTAVPLPDIDGVMKKIGRDGPLPVWLGD